ncbi:hypothetical protein BDN72DRAFT_955841 [Pluteus cervinus]|uniref:Uncharacterized protein n=1 Tax=Pluteus cervinus TaxID=181527 RepID=A0ACD3B948_9AGAR|nr:hypothetical protein BDN72DRAFT_955841 [Pluteus cervinus]
MEDATAPRLPPEIECMIFQIAARSTEPFALERINLLLVSKRTQHWIEPIIYQIFMYHGNNPQSNPLKQAPPPVPPSKFHFIRHLFLAGVEDNQETFIRSMLLECCNITALSLWAGQGANFVLNFILDGNLPSLKRLTINLHGVPKESLQRGLNSVTHLQLINLPPPGLCSFLTRCPNLTHLGFLSIVDISPSTVTSILSSSLRPRLKVLNITSFQPGDAVDTAKRERVDKYKELRVDDARVVCLRQPVKTYAVESLNAARGLGTGIWEFAEGIIQERTRKKVAKDAEEVQL